MIQHGRIGRANLPGALLYGQICIFRTGHKKSEVKISAPGLFALLIWEIFMGARYAPLDIAHLIRFSLNRVYFIGRNEGFQAPIETGKPQAVGPN